MLTPPRLHLRSLLLVPCCTLHLLATGRRPPADQPTGAVAGGRSCRAPCISLAGGVLTFGGVLACGGVLVVLSLASLVGSRITRLAAPLVGVLNGGRGVCGAAEPSAVFL